MQPDFVEPVCQAQAGRAAYDPTKPTLPPHPPQAEKKQQCFNAAALILPGLGVAERSEEEFKAIIENTDLDIIPDVISTLEQILTRGRREGMEKGIPLARLSKYNGSDSVFVNKHSLDPNAVNNGLPGINNGQLQHVSGARST